MENFLKETTELNSCQSTRDLAQKLNVLCSTVHEHLKEIWKTFKEGIWVIYLLSFENQLQYSTIWRSYLTRNTSLSFLY